jgi:hypothetical protein
MVSRNERDLIEAIAEDDEDLIEGFNPFSGVARGVAGAASSAGSAFTQVLPTNKAPSVARVANALSTADSRIDQVARRNRIHTSNLESQIEDLRRSVVLSTVLARQFQPEPKEITSATGGLAVGDKVQLASNSTLSSILPALLIMGGSERGGSNRNSMTTNPLMMVLMLQALNNDSKGDGTDIMPLLLIMMMQ